MEEAFKAIWEFVQTAGPAGIFAVMWWLERQGRIDAQEKLEALTKEILTAMTETAIALSAIKDVVSNRGRR